MTAEPPSGAQWELRYRSHRAVVVEVGGGLREYSVDDQPVLDGYPLERMADGGRGQPLLPWPNRLEDGQYTFEGRQLQLPIEEVDRHNAIHGLTRWVNWALAAQTDGSVRLEHMLRPRPGYPFSLALAIEYTLDERGLTVRTRAHNRGTTSLPFGAGQHPYFTVGTPLVDSAWLEIPARGRLEVDETRRLPTGRVLPVAETAPHPIGDAQLDDCFCDLLRDADGRARARLTDPQGTGRGLSVWLGQGYRYLQVFSGDTLVPERRRRGLAIEPMTCPSNAFRTATDVIVLDADESIELEWGVEAF